MKLKVNPFAHYWQTLDGDILHVPQIKDDHLLNIIKMLLRGKFGIVDIPRLKPVLAEAVRRDMANLLDLVPSELLDEVREYDPPTSV